MQRNHKTEQEKELRRFYEAYRNTWDSKKEHGQWKEVEPYQKGWVRFFELRDDIKNRTDAGAIQKVLEVVNNRLYCGREDFLYQKYTKGKKKVMLPLKQTVRYLLESTYEQLDERTKSYFSKKIWMEKRMYPSKHYVTITGYMVNDPYWFVYKIEPNVITHHWIPDSEWESHCQEIRNKIQRNNLWPKIYRMLGGDSMKEKGYLYNPAWMKSKYGENLSDEDFDTEIAA